MLEKLKSIGESIKNIVIYLLAPLSLVLGYVIYLKSKINTLNDKDYQNETEKQLKDFKSKTEEAENEAKKAEDTYKHDRDSFLNDDNSGK